MQKITIGYVVRHDGYILELAGPKGEAIIDADDLRSSRLWLGTTGTVFETRRDAHRAIERTKKTVAGTGSPFDGAVFRISRLTQAVPGKITVANRVPRG